MFEEQTDILALPGQGHEHSEALVDQLPEHRLVQRGLSPHLVCPDPGLGVPRPRCAAPGVHHQLVTHAPGAASGMLTTDIVISYAHF